MRTDNDYRVLLLEKAVLMLDKRIRNWSLPFPINKARLGELVRHIRSSVYRIKYSFLPASELMRSYEVKQLILFAQELKSEIFRNYASLHQSLKLSINQQLAVAEIRFHLWVILGFRQRLKRGDENLPEYAVDVIGTEVLSVQKHPRTSNLRVLKAGTEKYSFIVVTNLRSVRPGEIRAIAVLPPKEFMGVISEAMIVSSPLSQEFKGSFVPYSIINLNELRSKVIELLGTH